MKHNISSKLLRRIMPIVTLACLIIPGWASANVIDNMNDAAIQGILWSSMSLNSEKYKTAISEEKQSTQPSGKELKNPEASPSEKQNIYELLDKIEKAPEITK